MKVHFNWETHEVVVHLTPVEASRLTATIHKETHGLSDPDADAAGQLEDALMELYG
jgi:hypothetical protein